jgi:TatD DNase family protein
MSISIDNAHFCDAHCHPASLAGVYADAEADRLKCGARIAAFASFREELASFPPPSKDVRYCFAVHPQLLRQAQLGGPEAQRSLADFYALLEGGRLDAIGETGFDLYEEPFRSSTGEQEHFFSLHAEAAITHGLPLVLHVRKAMDRVFSHTVLLKRCCSVVFHSFSGTVEDARSLLRRGINAFFSLGTTLLLNHKVARRVAAEVEPQRLLTETDAPWQPLRGGAFSCYSDLAHIVAELAVLRGLDADALLHQVEANWERAYGVGS